MLTDGRAINDDDDAKVEVPLCTVRGSTYHPLVGRSNECINWNHWHHSGHALEIVVYSYIYLCAQQSSWGDEATGLCFAPLAQGTFTFNKL